MMSHRLICTLVCSLWLGATLASADESAKPTADRVKQVRQMYAKLPCEILDFLEPAKFRVAQKKGGSISLTLQDAKGKDLTIYLLGKLGESPDSLMLKAGRLPPRGPEESAVYGLLLRLAAKPAEKTAKGQLDLLDAVLAVLDERFAGAMPTPPKGAKK